MSARILIVTAAFGEGHNSAARNLAAALGEYGAETRVEDPCLLAIPHTTRAVCAGYRWVTTRWPALWHRIYRSTGQVDFSRQRMPLIRRPERRLAALIDEYRPDAVVSTYPLYPYFLTRIFEKSGRPVPVFSVVTDSIEINSAWLDARVDAWLVTDPHTREEMVRAGCDPARVIDTGFAIDPKFSGLEPVPATAAADPFRVLHFATRRLLHVRRISKAVLNASPHTRLTLVLGKNLRVLYPKAREIRDRFPGRVKIMGWTRRVPELLNRHHLVIGKAGGATVHEAIASRCPMLVHHLVPGQEEGNLRLLEKIGGGTLAAGPDAVSRELRELLADDAKRWREMKAALARHGRRAGGLTAARVILDHLGQAPPARP